MSPRPGRIHLRKTKSNPTVGVLMVGRVAIPIIPILGCLLGLIGISAFLTSVIGWAVTGDHEWMYVIYYTLIIAFVLAVLGYVLMIFVAIVWGGIEMIRESSKEVIAGDSWLDNKRNRE